MEFNNFATEQLINPIDDQDLARAMADAANPGYEDLRAGGRNLTLNQIGSIYMRIGEAMENVRLTYDSESSETSASQVAKEVDEAKVCTASPESEWRGEELLRAAKHLPGERNYELSHTLLKDNAENVFNTVRGTEFRDFITSERIERDDGALISLDTLLMYHPSTGITIRLQQSTVQKGPKAGTVTTHLGDVCIPVGDRGAKNRPIVVGRGVSYWPSGNYSFTEMHGTGLGECDYVQIKRVDHQKKYPDDVGFISHWSTRLMESIPLKNAGLVYAEPKEKNQRLPDEIAAKYPGLVSTTIMGKERMSRSTSRELQQITTRYRSLNAIDT